MPPELSEQELLELEAEALAIAELELEQERAAAGAPAVSHRPIEEQFERTMDAAGALRYVPFVGPALQLHAMENFKPTQAMDAEFQEKYGTTDPSLAQITGTNLRNAAIEAPLTTGRMVATAYPALRGAGMVPKIGGPIIQALGQEFTAGMVGESAGLLYDQATQALGLTEGPMTYDAETDGRRPKTFDEEARDALGRGLFSAGLGSAVRGATYAAPRAISAIAGNIEDRGLRALDADEQLTKALDDGSKAADTTGVRTGQKNYGPLGETVKRARGYTYEDPVTGEAKPILDKSVLKSDKPFTELTGRLTAAKNRTGQRVDEFVEGLEGQSSFQDTFSADPLSNRLSYGAGSATTRMARRVLGVERAEHLNKLVLSGAVNQDTAKTIINLGTKVDQLEALPNLTESQRVLLVGSKLELAKHLQKIPDLEPTDVLQYKRSFEDQANFATQAKDASKGEAYRLFANAPRRELNKMVLEERGLSGYRDWRGINRAYGDLARLEELASSQARFEAPPVEAFPGGDMIRGYASPRTGISAWVKMRAEPEALARLRIGLGEPGYRQSITNAAGAIRGGADFALENLQPTPGAATATAQQFMTPDQAPSFMQEAEAAPLALEAYPSTMSLKMEMPRAEARTGFVLDRNLATIDAQGVANLIGVGLPPEAAQPLILQWQQIVATGDMEKRGQFLGALAAKYPDFPLQTGALTGLPSEFDMGDGRRRLFSAADRDKWEQVIERSPLRLDEKALRIMQLRKSYEVYPLDWKLSQDVQSSPDGQALQHSLGQGPQVRREPNALGNRRVRD